MPSDGSAARLLVTALFHYEGPELEQPYRVMLPGRVEGELDSDVEFYAAEIAVPALVRAHQARMSHGGTAKRLELHELAALYDRIVASADRFDDSPVG